MLILCPIVPRHSTKLEFIEATIDSESRGSDANFKCTRCKHFFANKKPRKLKKIFLIAMISLLRGFVARFFRLYVHIKFNSLCILYYFFLFSCIFAFLTFQMEKKIEIKIDAWCQTWEFHCIFNVELCTSSAAFIYEETLVK